MSKAYQLVDFLHRRGFERLGAGIYSVVMARGDSDRCIKICRGRYYHHARTADQWCKYILWAHRMGYTGTFAPKLYSLHCFEDGLYAAVIERLWITLGDCQGEKYLEYYNLSRGIHEWFVESYPGPRGDFYRAFNKAFQGNLDLHEENWMIRHNGDLVLTDPLSGEGTSSDMRLRERDLGIAQIGATA